MSSSFKTVDLFAGPGGLAEGFSSLRNEDGSRIFDIAMSVEKESSAFSTLRLRAFVRQFETPPDAYYRYIARQITRQELIEQHPAEWAAAEHETAMLELGTEDAQLALDHRLKKIRKEASHGTVVIGGPPCQAYSLVGRARNRGIAGYDPAEDHRHFLYREYIRILQLLQPVAFVMENVKGILSSKVGDEGIFDRVLGDLREAGGSPDSYTLLPLVSSSDKGRHSGHIIRSENFGIPQTRHRVILLGIRKDVMARIPIPDTLERCSVQSTVACVLSGMPPLRSGLSKAEDTAVNWRATVVDAFESAASACRAEGAWQKEVAARLTGYSKKLKSLESIPPRRSETVTPIRDNRLGSWLCDTRLLALPNHETRGHMEGDLARYAFAAAFSEVFDRSPKAEEFPRKLAPAHSNWDSGKFADRFRVQGWKAPSTTITSHISKDGHYFIHPDPMQCRSLTVREAARLQTFPDNYFFEGNRTQQFVQVGNAVPPLLARQIAQLLAGLLGRAFSGQAEISGGSGSASG